MEKTMNSNQRRNNLIKASIIGGIGGAILSISIFRILNCCCCCLGTALCGIISVYFAGKFTGTDIKKEESIVIGLYTGLSAAVIAVVLNYIVTYLLIKVGFSNFQFLQTLEKNPQIINILTPGLKNILNRILKQMEISLQKGPSFYMLIIDFIFSSVINILFSFIGAVIGIKLMFPEKKEHDDENRITKKRGPQFPDTDTGGFDGSNFKI